MVVIRNLVQSFPVTDNYYNTNANVFPESLLTTESTPNTLSTDYNTSHYHHHRHHHRQYHHHRSAWKLPSGPLLPNQPFELVPNNWHPENMFSQDSLMATTPPPTLNQLTLSSSPSSPTCSNQWANGASLTDKSPSNKSLFDLYLTSTIHKLSKPNRTILEKRLSHDCTQNGTTTQYQDDVRKAHLGAKRARGRGRNVDFQMGREGCGESVSYNRDSIIVSSSYSNGISGGRHQTNSPSSLYSSPPPPPPPYQSPSLSYINQANSSQLQRSYSCSSYPTNSFSMINNLVNQPSASSSGIISPISLMCEKASSNHVGVYSEGNRNVTAKPIDTRQYSNPKRSYSFSDRNSHKASYQLHHHHHHHQHHQLQPHNEVDAVEIVDEDDSNKQANRNRNSSHSGVAISGNTPDAKQTVAGRKNPNSLSHNDSSASVVTVMSTTSTPLPLSLSKNIHSMVGVSRASSNTATTTTADAASPSSCSSSSPSSPSSTPRSSYAASVHFATSTSSTGSGSRHHHQYAANESVYGQQQNPLQPYQHHHHRQQVNTAEYQLNSLANSSLTETDASGKISGNSNSGAHKRSQQMAAIASSIVNYNNNNNNNSHSNSNSCISTMTIGAGAGSTASATTAPTNANSGLSSTVHCVPLVSYFSIASLFANQIKPRSNPLPPTNTTNPYFLIINRQSFDQKTHLH